MENPTYALGRTIAEFFQKYCQWPSAQTLQKQYKDVGSVERIAADDDQIIYYPSQEPECRLTLRGFDNFAPGAPEVDNFLATARYAGRRFLEEERAPSITSEDIRSDLGIDNDGLKKLGVLIIDWGGFWSSAGGRNDQQEFSFVPSRDAWYFESVQTVADFERAQERAAEDRSYSHKKRYDGQPQVVRKALVVKEAAFAYQAESGFKVTIDRFNIVRNNSLRNLLVADAVELNRLFEQGSWKSVGFLAGSCCEGVLLDLLEREEPRTSDRLGNDWRFTKGLSHLMNAAVSFGLISESSTELAKFLKRWRDLIHPWKAAGNAAPTREVALAIIALLEWLMAEVQQRDQRGGVA